MRDHSCRESRPAGVRGPGAGAVPVRAPDTDIPEAQPTQGLLAEVYGVSQATASRVITAYTPLIARALEVSVPTVEDLDPTVQLIVDGTLLQCWSWADHPELYSGKHRTSGVNVQVTCALSGRLAWVSDPHDGRVHDTEALRRCRLLDVPPVNLSEAASPPRHIGIRGISGWA